MHVAAPSASILLTSDSERSFDQTHNTILTLGLRQCYLLCLSTAARKSSPKFHKYVPTTISKVHQDTQ